MTRKKCNAWNSSVNRFTMQSHYCFLYYMFYYNHFEISHALFLGLFQNLKSNIWYLHTRAIEMWFTSKQARMLKPSKFQYKKTLQTKRMFFPYTLFIFKYFTIFYFSAYLYHKYLIQVYIFSCVSSYWEKKHMPYFS